MKVFTVIALIVLVIAALVYARYAIYTSDLPLWAKLIILK